jgi:drug/metabolite transporter (DMT)-like permease
VAERSILPALAALGAAATWALASHLFRRALERADGAVPPSPAAANLYKNLLAGAVFAAVAGLSGGEFPDRDHWPALALSGFFGFAVGDMLFFAALPRVGVQVAAMCSLVHVPAAVLLGWIVHGEQLAPRAWIGGALIVAGVLLVLTEAPRGVHRDPSARRLGIRLALLAALAQAVGVVTGHGQEVLGGTLARMSGGIVGACVIAIVLGIVLGKSSVSFELGQLRRPWTERASRRGLVVAALCGSVIGLPLFHYALRGMESGAAAVLFATTPLFTLPIGFAFGERHGLRSVFGAGIGIAGVAAVVWAAN